MVGVSWLLVYQRALGRWDLALDNAHSRDFSLTK